MIFDDDLSDDEIDALYEKPTRSYDIPGTTKKKRFDPTIRTVTNWFKLPITLEGECQIPTHDEERSPRNAKMVYVNDEGIHMCRWCFIESRDLQ